MIDHRMIILPIACMTSALTTASLHAQELQGNFARATQVIQTRCLSCHDTDTREGGIDLSPLLVEANAANASYARLWIKVDEKVSRGEMPPPDDTPLTSRDQDAITRWFHHTYVLREGKPHIGASPLRRLTRYELVNTLEDVLAIRLRLQPHGDVRDRIPASRIESLVPSDIPGESGFDNDARRMESLKPPLQEIAEAAHYALELFANDSAAQKTVLGRDSIPAQASASEIRALLHRFLQRAYRCEPSAILTYVPVYFDLYQNHFRRSNDTRRSLLHVFEMILVSPEFLYRLETSKDLATPYPVTGIELATRLSYFLWSSRPDEELIRLGTDESLLDDDVLRSQIARMLNSRKRLSLSENFAGQWLGFDELISNREFFVDEQWNRETYDEVLFFFDELIRSNRSLLEIVNSDWIYRRHSALATQDHGYQPLAGDALDPEFADVLTLRRDQEQASRRGYKNPVLVKTRNDREGGIITSAAIMRLTASKNRTSPIRRGVWVLTNVIGRTLEPPPNIPTLEEARATLTQKTNPSVAEVLQQHVSKPECVSCHKSIDPLGLGLENFSPTGEWRIRYPDQSQIVSTGVMPNGSRFHTPRKMKALLLEMYEDDIARHFVGTMFAYALGRKLEPFDRVSLDSMMREIKTDGYRMSTVIEQIVLSKQFRHRQDR